MLAPIALGAAMLSLVQADWNADVSGFISADEVLYTSVSNWNAGVGIFGALGIQGYFPTLQSSLSVLSADAAHLSGGDVDASAVENFGVSVVTLLDALTAKANDFSSVGLKTIVKNDISSIVGPAVDVVSGIVTAIDGDCGKVNSLTSVLSEVSSALHGAGNAYGVAIPALASAHC